MDILKEYLSNGSNIEKVAISTSFGGFSVLSLIAHLGFKKEDKYFFNNDRSNPVLIKAIEECKPDDLEIVEIAWEDIPRAILKNYNGTEEIFYGHVDMAYPIKDYLFNITNKKGFRNE